MHYYRASTASKSKSLAFLILILLLASPLLLHHSSASSQQEDNQDWYDDWSQDPYANCISFPCPVPEYPPDNDCTLITAINPITNTTETSTYMITHNLPEDSTQEACLKVVPYGRPDREGCNSIGCHKGEVFSTLNNESLVLQAQATIKTWRPKVIHSHSSRPPRFYVDSLPYFNPFPNSNKTPTSKVATVLDYPPPLLTSNKCILVDKFIPCLHHQQQQQHYQLPVRQGHSVENSSRS
ncbi:hypothetical protein K457DRAFT_23098 [Linnemannia elongata AG-77]|uniref:Uncharacterized protein n=1 Tax=Linnemannia elongata AG-77 TaxID=1314771 RepID=A0A197JJT8_9FUNG|nr:hypothetical protein K457DRAFT_23098 [Linnemannia elongata AG-77]